jgi:hypothetical protein
LNNKKFILWEQASRDTIDFKKIYVDVSGDLISGLLLSQIVYWNLPDKYGKTKLRVEHNGKLWLAKERKAWWDECRITPKQYDRAIKILADKNLVEVVLKKFNGLPIPHIFLNIDELTYKIEYIFEYGNTTEGKTGIDQRGIRELTFGEKGNLPLGNSGIDQRGIPITETTPKTTPETTPEKLADHESENNFEERFEKFIRDRKTETID